MALGIVLSFDFIPYKMVSEFLPMLEGAFTHVFVPELWGRDALTQIATLAGLAERDITYGTAIVNLYSRTPATLAQTAASLSELTDGQFILGLGLSGPIVIENWHGIPFDEHSPLQRTREYFDIIRLILSGERCNYEGLIFKLKNFRLRAKSATVPLFLAALGPKNVNLAGEIADGWFPIWTPLKGFEVLIQDLELGKETRSRDLPWDVDIAPLLITCSSDSPKAKLLVQNHIAYYVGGMGTFYNNLMKRLGFATEAEKIQIAWKNGDRTLAASCVSNAMIDQIAVLGTEDELPNRYEQLRKQGITIPILMLPFNCPPDLALKTVQDFTRI
ncbi:MAG: LLM class flavin-dependent oxidoreductase [Candidatus Hodarchaeota archaeon]